MRTIIRILLALVFVALAVPASAGTWKPFLHGVKTPAELADKVQASLTKDPSGRSIIDPERCKRDGSCATPENYFEMFQKSDPDSHLTGVAQVPAFLKKLEVAPAPAGEYWIACLKPSGDGAYKPELHCLSRFFKKGEKAWVNPLTKRIVLASDCTNPVEKPAPPKHACALIPFTTKVGDTVVRFDIQGPAEVKDDCIGVKRAGEEDFERWWADECKNVHCDFSDNARFMGQKVRLIGSYIPEPGEHVLRVPASFAEKGSLYSVGLCLERTKMAWPEYPAKGYTLAERDAYAEQRDKWIAGHSDTMNVVWQGYRTNSTGIKEARVYYTKAEVPPGAPLIYWPWQEFAKLHPEWERQEAYRIGKQLGEKARQAPQR